MSRRTTTRKRTALQESTEGSICFQCPNSSVCRRCCVFMLALTLLLRNNWRIMVKTIKCTQMSMPHQQGHTAKQILSFADKPLVVPGQLCQSHPNFLTFHLSISKEISLVDKKNGTHWLPLHRQESEDDEPKPRGRLKPGYYHSCAKHDRKFKVIVASQQ